MKDKILALILNHVEKAVFGLVLIFGILHVTSSLATRDYSEKRKKIDDTLERIKTTLSTSTPDKLVTEDSFKMLKAPFERVPPTQLASHWHFYYPPNITRKDILVKMGTTLTIKLSIIEKFAKDGIKIIEGQDLVKVTPSQTISGQVDVAGLKEGKAVIEYLSSNQSKETHFYTIFYKKPPQKIDYVAQPPLKMNTVVERARVVITCQFNKDNNDSQNGVEVLGHQLYRKEIGGEFVKLVFEKYSETDTDLEAESKDKLPAGAVRIPGGAAHPEGAGVPGGAKDAMPPMPSGTGAGAMPSETGAGAMPGGTEAGTGVGTMSKVIRFVDDKFKEDTSYIYAITTIGKHPKSGDKLVSEKVIGKEIVTKSNTEIFFTGTTSTSDYEFANVSVRKWLSESEHLDKPFLILVGDSIGRKTFIRKKKQSFDFATGAFLIDIIPDIRLAEEVEREANVFDANGNFELDKDGKPLKIKKKVQRLKRRSAKIIIVDAKGRTLELMKAEAKRTKTAAKAGNKEKSSSLTIEEMKPGKKMKPRKDKKKKR